MGLAVFYDPCFKCEHKDTKNICNMCELTYYRNQHVSKEMNHKLYTSFDYKHTHKELEGYVDKKFQDVKTKLEEQNEQGTSKA